MTPNGLPVDLVRETLFTQCLEQADPEKFATECQRNSMVALNLEDEEIAQIWYRSFACILIESAVNENGQIEKLTEIFSSCAKEAANLDLL